MANKKFDWSKVHSVIDSIPIGFWMSYGDVCEAAGLNRTSAMAVGMALARAKYVPKNVYRVLRKGGEIPTSWKGEIGDAESCRKKLEEEGISFDQWGCADQTRRYIPRSSKS